MKLNRKEFLGLGASSLFLGSALSRIGNLEAVTTLSNKLLVNILLEGGPDFRHLIVPKPNSTKGSYEYEFWNARVSSILKGTAADNFNSWQSAYTANYEEITLSGKTFGVLKTANGRANANGWLISMIKAGKVAIVNNVQFSKTRDHSQSLLVLQSGSYTTASGQANNDGWGGRLISTIGAGRLVSFSSAIRPFCNTANKQYVLTFNNSRDFGLKQPSSSITVEDRNMRALKSYYQARDFSALPVHKKFQDQYTKVQALSQGVQSALTQTTNATQLASQYPTDVANLFSGNNRLDNQNFANQIRCLYDALNVNSVLDMRIASLNYGGWDSHKNQVVDIEPQFDDLFGSKKSLNLIYDNISNPGNVAFVISGEFGRQLKSNGDAGTDHGRGNSVLIIGGNVVGGLYGELFPTTETSLFKEGGKDIEGLTAFGFVLGRLCNWMSAGSGATIFTGTDNTTKVESSAVQTQLNSLIS
ncbi:MAG: DUF1501 domain-containing protein [Leptospiraceae bacterium]|nr:DUF1501 domain-containing protein [Leptospiraceae bacterium]